MSDKGRNLMRQKKSSLIRSHRYEESRHSLVKSHFDETVVTLNLGLGGETMEMVERIDICMKDKEFLNTTYWKCRYLPSKHLAEWLVATAAYQSVQRVGLATYDGYGCTVWRRYYIYDKLLYNSRNSRDVKTKGNINRGTFRVIRFRPNFPLRNARG